MKGKGEPMKLTYKERELFTCDICAQRFRSLTKLRRHIRAKHPEELRQGLELITTEALQELADQGVIEVRYTGGVDAPGQQFTVTAKKPRQARAGDRRANESEEA